MSIDASARARGLGIEAKYKDLRGGAGTFLPQRIAVLAQGASAVSYSTEKWQATSAVAAGSRYGFGSPIHLALEQLMPANGDGVGTIPVTVYPLEDDDSGAPAVGDITPSGTATAAGAYRVLVSGIRSEAFVMPSGAVDVIPALRAIHAAVSEVPRMPVIPTFEYGALTSEKTITTGTSNGTLGTLSVTGAPIPGVWTLECIAEAVDAGTFRLTDPDGLLVSNTVTVGVTNAGGIQFTLTDGSEDFDTGDTFEITVPATAVNLTAKWEGESGNDLYIEVQGESLGVTFAVTQPTGGLVNPDVEDALGQMGEVWETMCLNALNISDTDTLDAFQAFGEPRWGALVRRPLVVFTGNTEADVSAATAVSSARRTDRVNAQLVAPGSVNLPFVVAARQLTRIARVANNNPPKDYGSQRATGLLPGADGEQWDYVARDQALKAGSSSIKVKDGVVALADTVTFYRPEGDPDPAYRYVVDIVKLQNVYYRFDLEFSKEEWDGAPLIPDDQPTLNPEARKPSSAKGAGAAILDSLGDDAIISDPKSAKESMLASINPSNPKRLDFETTVQLSGNTNIVDVMLNFGFFFGSAG